MKWYLEAVEWQEMYFLKEGRTNNLFGDWDSILTDRILECYSLILEA